MAPFAFDDFKKRMKKAKINRVWACINDHFGPTHIWTYLGWVRLSNVDETILSRQTGIPPSWAKPFDLFPHRTPRFLNEMQAKRSMS